MTAQSLTSHMSEEQRDRFLIVMTIRDPRTLACPICEHSIDVPPVRSAPAVAGALGVSARVLLETHADQQAKRGVSAMRQHLSEHKVDDWLLALSRAAS